MAALIGRADARTLGTRRIMGLVLLALLPGALVLVDHYGAGYLLRLPLAIVLGLGVEAVCVRLRGGSLAPVLGDASTLVTCTLLVLALPPHTPWWVLATAVVAAVGIAKHVYGGLGNNPFNPAVVGYAVALVSFPGALAGWPVPADGLTGATALTSFKYREGRTVADAWLPEFGFGAIGGYGWEWINLAFLAGGVLLLVLRIAAWRVPVSLLATLGLLAALGYDGGSSASLGSPFYHWFSGGTLLAAFFFATDPVTHPASARGQVLFGCLIGAVTYAIRAAGNYPDGLAFAILLANATAPYLDQRWAVRRG